jgi:hypothetical protein
MAAFCAVAFAKGSVFMRTAACAMAKRKMLLAASVRKR